jgi:hypothetical protein
MDSIYTKKKREGMREVVSIFEKGILMTENIILPIKPNNPVTNNKKTPT